jgi:hypothetical protein
MSPVLHELAAMSQVPQIRVMAAKARVAGRGSTMPSRGGGVDIASIKINSRGELFIAAIDAAATIAKQLVERSCSSREQWP